MKLEDVKMKWTSGAANPYGSIDVIYHIILNKGKMYFTDGNLEVEIKGDPLKNIFTPVGCSWNDVDFTDEVKQTKTK